LRGFQHVGADDELRRQHVEGDVTAVVVARDDAVLERDDVVLGTQAADPDFLALTAGGALQGDARQVRKCVADVGIRKAPELDRVDGIQHHRRVALDVERFRQVGGHAVDDDLLQLLFWPSGRGVLRCVSGGRSCARRGGGGR